MPGSKVGWGFTLSNKENYLVVTSANFETPTTLGSFTDFISASNFFVVGPAANASTVWGQPFNAGIKTGIGSFSIDKAAAAGGVAVGNIVLNYDLFSRSPMDVRFNPDTDTLSTGNLLTALASVTVTAIPEPSSNALLLAGLGVLAFAARRRRA